MANSANYQFHSNSGAKSRCICQCMQFDVDVFPFIYEIFGSQAEAKGAGHQ